MEDKNLKNELAISNSQSASHNLGNSKKSVEKQEEKLKMDSSKIFNLEDYKMRYGLVNAYLDRLTIVGNLPDEFQGDLSVFGAIPIDILARYPNGGYRGQLYSDRKQKLYFDYDPEKAKKMRIRNFRIECNPNLLAKDQLVMLFTKVVPVLVKVGISRLDLAFDYERELKDYTFSKALSGGKFWDKGGNTQTIYFGSPTSDYRVRLYDKKAERLAKGSEEDKAEYSAYDVLWRLEFELTGSGFIEKQIRNGFEVLESSKISKRNYDIKLENPLSPVEKIMLKAFDEDKDSFNMLGKNTKSKYRKLASDIKVVNLSTNLKNIVHQLQVCSDYPFYIDLLPFCGSIYSKNVGWITEV